MERAVRKRNNVCGGERRRCTNATKKRAQPRLCSYRPTFPAQPSPFIVLHEGDTGQNIFREQPSLDKWGLRSRTRGQGQYGQKEENCRGRPAWARPERLMIRGRKLGKCVRLPRLLCSEIIDIFNHDPSWRRPP